MGGAVGNRKGGGSDEIQEPRVLRVGTPTRAEIVGHWVETAKHPRFNRLYTDLVYQPMLEVMKYLRTSGFRTYIVTGGGQDFVRAYAQRVYGIPPEQVIGSSLAVAFHSGLLDLQVGERLRLDRELVGKVVALDASMTGRGDVPGGQDLPGEEARHSINAIPDDMWEYPV